MNVLFLTLSNFTTIKGQGIYPDLLRKFCEKGNNVFIVSPTERRNNKKTYIIEEESCRILKVRTGNIQKTNIIEKGISTVLLEGQFKRAIKKYFSNVKFDLVLYSTPPITLAGAVKYIKKRDDAKTYLLLKDIFPQNAVDIGMMQTSGIKSLIYKIFRKKEKELYRLSDAIGCMSEANVDFLLKHNPEIDKAKVEICPNCIEPLTLECSCEDKMKIREKYSIPVDKKVFIYGGNLGKPQGIPFLVECLKKNVGREDAYFIICGRGTDYSVIREFFDNEKPKNMLLINGLPTEEFERLVSLCDVGLIFLDKRFTIPNFPSRLLSYLQAKIPVIAATDKNTDLGKVITDGKFGLWCESSLAEDFTEILNIAMSSDLKEMGKKGYEYLMREYTTDKGYEIIIKTYKKLCQD